MEQIKFKPLSNYIVLDVRRRKLLGGLVVPDTVKDPINSLCIVVRVSEELDEHGKPMVKNVKVGDNVVFDNIGSFFVNTEGRDYLCVRETSLIGILEEPYDETDFEPIELHKTKQSAINKKLIVN